MGVKYVLNKNDALSQNLYDDTDTFPKDKYKLIWQDAPWQIYENMDALPRFFIAENFLVATNSAVSIGDVYNKNINLERTVILNNKPDLKIDSNAIGSASLISYNSNKVEIKTSVSSNSLLFLSDSYYNGWEALIDGKRTGILKADYSFRAVAVPSGVHIVTFSYNPPLFYLGLKLSVLSLLTFLIIIFGIKIYEKKK